MNWYAYCANNPLKYIDPTGLTYVILWSYSGAELEEYTDEEGNVDWAKFESESLFAKAAETKRQELIDQGVDPKDIMLERIDGADDLKETWGRLQKLDKVDGLDMFTHTDVRGGDPDNFWADAGKLNWSKGATAVFHGCHTAGRARVFSRAQGITTYGQSGSSSFSTSPTMHLRANPGAEKVYLYDYNFMNIYNTDGLGQIFTPPPPPSTGA